MNVVPGPNTQQMAVCCSAVDAVGHRVDALLQGFGRAARKTDNKPWRTPERLSRTYPKRTAENTQKITAVTKVCVSETFFEEAIQR